MAKYEFPTEPCKDNYDSHFAGAVPAYSMSHGKFNLGKCQAITIREAAALHYGMHPDYAIDYVYGYQCGTIQPQLLGATSEGLIRAVMAGAIRTIELDKPSNKDDITLDTMVITEDVLSYFGSKSDQQEIDSAVFQQKDELKIPETERNTMLKLIIGMAMDAYTYDPKSSRNELTGNNKNSLSAKLALKGIIITDDTIRKYLKEAKNIL